MSKTFQKGMTLIEMVVSLGIFVIIAGALTTLIVDNYQFQRRSMEEGESQYNAQTVLANMRRELRSAIQGDNGAYPIASANNQELVFFSDIDYDGEVERVRYTINGTNLYKGVIEPVGQPAVYDSGTEDITTASTIIANASDPLFYYYDNTYTGSEPAMDPISITDISLIKISLITDSEPATPDQGRYEIETDIQLRNLHNED